jgi:hypothetical protein
MPGGFAPLAVAIGFDNATNGFVADTVQAAIEEARAGGVAETYGITVKAAGRNAAGSSFTMAKNERGRVARDVLTYVLFISGGGVTRASGQLTLSAGTAMRTGVL